jgi:hypothetical protein
MIISQRSLFERFATLGNCDKEEGVDGQQQDKDEILVNKIDD